jgi:hypothetical protein
MLRRARVPASSSTTPPKARSRPASTPPHKTCPSA